MAVKFDPHATGSVAVGGGAPGGGASGRGGRYKPAHRKTKRSSRRRTRYRVLGVVSVGAIVAGVGVAGDIGWFYFHSSTTGAALLRQEKSEIARQSAPLVAAKSSRPQPACQAPTVARGQPGGIVTASEIHMQAPVVQGEADSQLAVAVGHDSASVWPGQPGTAVLAAHDVSWFSHIDGLRPGALIDFQTPCDTYVFTVTTSKIVAQGSPVYNTAAPSLVLSTCYPLDALWLTSQRYLVYANLTKVVSGGAAATVPAPAVGALVTSLPSYLVSSVAARVTTSAPLGPLSISGNADAAWVQSDQPINAAGSALQLYFGSLQLVAERNFSGWEQAAPKLAAGAVWGEQVVSTISRVTPTLDVSGSTVTGATVTSEVRLGNGGVYSIDMGATMISGKLTVTAWTVTRA